VIVEMACWIVTLRADGFENGLEEIGPDPGVRERLHVSRHLRFAGEVL
jgi:hypothetical protein